jgi:HAD superfamily hydrolase (TIGR01459 family)
MIHNTILDVNTNYKGIILDIWGVLHSSGIPFDGVHQALIELRKRGKKILLVSNAPRRSNVVEDFLKASINVKKGLHFDGILTSGELFFSIMSKRNSKDKAFYIGPEKDLQITQSLNLKFTQNLSHNPVIAVLTGTVDGWAEMLKQIKSLNLPLYCLNPDIFIVKKDGSEEECAGFVALEYKKMGGEVIYFGKPYNQIYQQAMEFFKDFTKEEIIAVGDGMETDIKGANDFGIRSALCLAGLPSVELAKGTALNDFMAKFDAKPDFIIKSL